MFSAWFKHEMTGFECWVISSNEDALKQIALRPSRKMKLFNGSLECSFRNYSIYAGSKKGRKMEGGVSEE
jgi:putative N6-adenine-specific DNA methylase